MNLQVETTAITSTGREAVRQLVAQHVGPEIVYTHDPDGSPRLEGSPLLISASHSRHHAAIALHPTLRPGVDIEEDRPGQLSRVAGKFLTEAEAALWAGRLLEAWTCKEAAYKAAGTPGLALTDIDLTTPGEARLPDGRRFRLETIRTADYALTTALPLTPTQ